MTVRIRTAARVMAHTNRNENRNSGGKPRDCKLNYPSHHNVALSERGNDFESLSPEHRDSSEPISIGSPFNHRISLNQPSSPLSYGSQRGLQRSGSYSLFAMSLLNYKTGDSPHFLHPACGIKSRVFWVAVNPREFLLGTVLTPSYGLSLRIDQDPMRATVCDELSLLAAVSLGPFDP